MNGLHGPPVVPQPLSDKLQNHRGTKEQNKKRRKKTYVFTVFFILI